MVWKCDFFWWFMRLVRVPPYESWANWTNFLGSWENGKFFWGQTCCTLLHTQNEEKSQKISTCIRIHTCVYANTWWWGQICPPPRTNRVKDISIFQNVHIPARLMVDVKLSTLVPQEVDKPRWIWILVIFPISSSFKMFSYLLPLWASLREAPLKFTRGAFGHCP